ncbi:hypothetical protein PC123_g26294, partial [Phytophthora cactorum]
AEQKEHPVLRRDQKFQALLLTNTLSFADTAINLVDLIAEEDRVLYYAVATVFY